MSSKNDWRDSLFCLQRTTRPQSLKLEDSEISTDRRLDRNFNLLPPIISYHGSASPSSLESLSIAETTQSVIINWPGVNGTIEGKTRDKAPTELVYRNGEIFWGAQIVNGEQRHQWFKLDLCPEADRKSYLVLQYPDDKALPPGYNFSAADLASAFLNCLRKHTMQILEQKLGKYIVTSTPIEWIITVPATWSDAGKDNTRACARRAGMGEEVQIISEPEAAVIYTLDAQDPIMLEVGHRFVVVDAGGGTVDLILYRISEKPSDSLVKVEEATHSDGHVCGGVFLNRMFKKWLITNFEDHLGWEEETLDGAMASFEEDVKLNFDQEIEEVIVQVPWLQDDASKGVRRMKLTVPGETMRSIFEPVISTICSLVLAQIQAAGKVRAVLLVGGFDQSKYLRQCIGNVVGEGIELIQPVNGQTAVARGALIKALTEARPTQSRINVMSRLARKSYGLCLRSTWISGKDAVSRKIWDEFHGEWVVSKMDWLVTKGTTLKETQPVVIEVVRHSLVENGPLHLERITIHVYDGDRDTPPVYPEQGSEPLVVLHADLSPIATSQIPIRIREDLKKHCALHYEVRVTFESAAIKYALWYKNVCYGTVHAQYA